ncbi:MAG: hypothetical protein HONBIEJF_01010 [Fimbriimonadaceae bacterium]|nr:hypothetical protein [Fimbriimonadaceae bacterium]
MTSGFWATISLQDSGGPKVIDADPATGAIVMERVLPGTSLLDADLGENENIEIFAAAAARLSGVASFSSTPLDSCWSRKSELLLHLLNTSPDPVFLHGDLHHENLLLSEADGWVTIDPKGLVGDPAFEAIAWLRNPLESQIAIDLLDARLDFFEARFGWDRWRMMAWSYVDLQYDEAGRNKNSLMTRLQEAIEERLY